MRPRLIHSQLLFVFRSHTNVVLNRALNCGVLAQPQICPTMSCSCPLHISHIEAMRGVCGYGGLFTCALTNMAGAMQGDIVCMGSLMERTGRRLWQPNS